ncbi:MAG TPA: hypothetical protein VF017_21145 [Thermoanaerobaculia bacterium]|nr:hypothetical protein [Thermoanaerobaculia bacterium]
MFVAVIALLCCAGVAQAQVPVNPGIDLWETQAGTYANFADNPLPAGFFPGCALPFAGQVPLVGDPIAADKAIGTSDTIVQRTGTINFGTTGTGTTGLVMAALCLKNTSWVDPCGGAWGVKVRLSTPQVVGSLTATLSSASGGSFSTNLTAKGDVIFSNGGTNLTATDTINLSGSGLWQYTPPPGAVVVSGPVMVDSNCDGTLDKVLPGTSNFFPGSVTHTGPHPVKPPKPCQDTVPTNAVGRVIKCAVVADPAAVD